MGIRGEVFSTKVLLPNRTYFFNVKENRLGDLYLNIVESKNRETGGFERQSVILFADDLTEFLKGFDESLHVLEKSVREKKRNERNDRGESRGTGRRSPESQENRSRDTKDEGEDPANRGRKKYTSRSGAENRKPIDRAAKGRTAGRSNADGYPASGRSSANSRPSAEKYPNDRPSGPRSGAGKEKAGANPKRPKRVVVRKGKN
jgi:hypothetical protein